MYLFCLVWEGRRGRGFVNEVRGWDLDTGRKEGWGRDDECYWRFAVMEVKKGDGERDGGDDDDLFFFLIVCALMDGCRTRGRSVSV